MLDTLFDVLGFHFVAQLRTLSDTVEKTEQSFEFCRLVTPLPQHHHSHPPTRIQK